MAEIYPSKSRPDPVHYIELALRNVPLGVSPAMSAAIEAHRKARAKYNANTRLADSVALGREPTSAETRKFNRIAAAEDKALLDLCATPARNAAEYHTKAEYLSALDYELIDVHVNALLRSMMWVHRPLAAGL